MCWRRSRSLRRISATALIALGLTTAVLDGISDQAAVRVSPGTLEILKSVDSLAPHVVGLFRDPIGFKQTGIWTGGFFLPGRGAPRVVLGSLALNGVGTLSFDGRSLLMSHPESGWLMTKYSAAGTPLRSLGRLRRTGQEADRDVHLALNAGIPIAEPGGGFYFVFMAGPPAFRKYDAKGELVYERVVQGREIDPLIAAIPDRWPRRSGAELPLVAPTVRTAAVDRSGRLWVSFVIPVTYVFDTAGEKIRTVQFRGAGVIAPSSLWFSDKGRVLVTPGCYEFAP